MTQFTHKLSFEPFYYRTVGFDKMLDSIDSILNTTVTDKYPPHNIISLSDNRYVIEIAVAGFEQEDIDITLDHGILTVKANAKLEGKPNVTYVYKGIGTRSFEKVLRLADTVEVRDATFENGILRINLENVIPDNKKIRKIEIGKHTSAKAELLAE